MSLRRLTTQAIVVYTLRRRILDNLETTEFILRKGQAHGDVRAQSFGSFPISVSGTRQPGYRKGRPVFLFPMNKQITNLFKMVNRMTSRGQVTVEYFLLFVAVALVTLVSLATLDNDVATTFENTLSDIATNMPLDDGGPAMPGGGGGGPGPVDPPADPPPDVPMP